MTKKELVAPRRKDAAQQTMFMVKGKGMPVLRDDFDMLQHIAYTEMIPKRMDGTTSVFDLTAWLPDGKIAKCEAVFYRGCNGFAMPSEFVDQLVKAGVWREN